jgi:hypothetical protein
VDLRITETEPEIAVVVLDDIDRVVHGVFARLAELRTDNSQIQ